MKIYLSYKREDRNSAAEISEALRQLGHEVSLDFDLLPGEDFANIIRRRIEESDLIVVVWSQRAKESDWVRGEALLATEQNKYFGIVLDRVELPVPLNLFQHLDLADVHGDKLVQRLAAALPSAVRRAGVRRRPAQTYEQHSEAFDPAAQTRPPPNDAPSSAPPAPQTPASPNLASPLARPFDVFISYSRKDEESCRTLFDRSVA